MTAAVLKATKQIGHPPRQPSRSTCFFAAVGTGPAAAMPSPRPPQCRRHPRPRRLGLNISRAFDVAMWKFLLLSGCLWRTTADQVPETTSLDHVQGPGRRTQVTKSRYDYSWYQLFEGPTTTTFTATSTAVSEPPAKGWKWWSRTHKGIALRVSVARLRARANKPAKLRAVARFRARLLVRRPTLNVKVKNARAPTSGGV